MQDLVKSRKFMVASVVDGIGTFVIAAGVIYLEGIKLSFLPVVSNPRGLGWALIIIGILMFIPMLTLIIKSSKQQQGQLRAPPSQQGDRDEIMLNGKPLNPKK